MLLFRQACVKTVIADKQNSKEFTSTLYDTLAARALIEKLTMTLIMQELNGNKKYNYLPFALPTSNESGGNIKTGDIL